MKNRWTRITGLPWQYPNDTCSQKTMIAKFRERWEKLKESAKRKRNAKANAGADTSVREQRIDEEPEAEVAAEDGDAPDSGWFTVVSWLPSHSVFLETFPESWLLAGCINSLMFDYLPLFLDSSQSHRVLSPAEPKRIAIQIYTIHTTSTPSIARSVLRKLRKGKRGRQKKIKQTNQNRESWVILQLHQTFAWNLAKRHHRPAVYPQPWR